MSSFFGISIATLSLLVTKMPSPPSFGVMLCPRTDVFTLPTDSKKSKISFRGIGLDTICFGRSPLTEHANNDIWFSSLNSNQFVPRLLVFVVCQAFAYVSSRGDEQMWIDETKCVLAF